MKTSPRWLALWGIGLGILIMVAVLGFWTWNNHQFAGTLLDPTRPAPNFTLIDETQTPFELNQLKGKWVFLFFGYTSCPDICPATLSQMRQVEEQLGALAEQVEVVFISVDPERDTPEKLQEYVSHFGEDFKGLSGTSEQIAMVAQLYGVSYEKEESDSAIGYLVSHSAYLYLIDPHFEWRAIYPFGVSSTDIVADVRFLMR